MIFSIHEKKTFDQTKMFFFINISCKEYLKTPPPEKKYLSKERNSKNLDFHYSWFKRTLILPLILQGSRSMNKKNINVNIKHIKVRNKI